MAKNAKAVREAAKLAANAMKASPGSAMPMKPKKAAVSAKRGPK